MKTKNLMTAFALSAMFAACSQDTELNETIAKNDFSNIPMVEANFTVNTGVDSRMATGWGWELKDKVGFAWLGATGMTQDGKAYQNNPLYCIDTKGAFSAEGMFYIGKYFAYMPYTEGSHSVEAIKFNVTGQPLTTSSASLAKHAIYISPEVYTLEKEDADGNVTEGNLPSGIGKNLPLTIARVSNAATINLTFANADELEDLKVLGVSLDVTDGSNSLLPKSFTYAPTTGVNVEKWTEYNQLTTGATTTYEVGAIAATSKEGIAVVDNALTINMLTMPVSTTASKINIVVTTNYGEVTVTEASTYDAPYNEPCITYGEDKEGNEYELTDSPIFNNLGANGELNVYVDMAGIKVGSSVVKTQDELNKILNTLVVSGYDAAVSVTINPEKKNRDENFVLSNFTLPEGLNAKIVLNTGGNATKGIIFEGNTVINKAIVLNAKATVKGDMTVENIVDENDNQYYTISGIGKITVANGSNLINNGKIGNPIETVAYDNVKKVAAGLYVSNSNGACANGSFNNNGAIKWIAGTVPALADRLIYSEVTDFATMAAASKAKVTTVRFSVNTTFGNNGLDLNTNEFENIKYVEIYAPVTINMTKNGVTNEPTKVSFKGLSNNKPLNSGEVPAFQIMEGASLTVISDLKDNTINFGSDITMKMAKNTELNLTKVTFEGIYSIDNSGSVLTSGSKLNANIVGSGSSSSVN